VIAELHESESKVSLSTEANNVNWLVANFVERTPGVEQAVAVSSDGLSQGAAAELNKGPVVQVLIEMGSAYLFVSSISGGSTLGVVAVKNCDLGLVGYEIAMFVDRVGAQLTPSLVVELKNSLVGV